MLRTMPPTMLLKMPPTTPQTMPQIMPSTLRVDVLLLKIALLYLLLLQAALPSVAVRAVVHLDRFLFKGPVPLGAVHVEV